MKSYLSGVQQNLVYPWIGEPYISYLIYIKLVDVHYTLVPTFITYQISFSKRLASDVTPEFWSMMT